jgi:hypothetical protein
VRTHITTIGGLSETFPSCKWLRELISLGLDAWQPLKRPLAANMASEVQEIFGHLGYQWSQEETLMTRTKTRAANHLSWADNLRFQS